MVSRRIWQAHTRGQGLRTRKRPPRKAERPSIGPAEGEGAGPKRVAAYAASLIFSAATAKRFEIGWKISPASLSIISLPFELSAII